MMALLRKDLLVYFTSPIAYVSLGLFLLLTGFAFSAQVYQVDPGRLPEASMRGITYFIAVVMLFISPLMTMRSFADEVRSKTMELLKTAPISDTEIVLAKFLAAWTFFSIMILATLEFPIVMLLFGKPDIPPLFTNYLGLWLAGGAFLSVGIFMSSLVSSPMLAAMMSFVALLILWFMGGLNYPLADQISIIVHLESFSVGVLDLSDLSYYILFMAAFIFLTIRVQEATRWK